LPYYEVSVATDPLPLPSNPECIVHMKRKGDYGAELDVQDALVKINANQMDAIQAAQQKNGHRKNGMSAEALKTLGLSKIELAESKRVMTVSLIVSWNLEDENGQPRPITVETLNKLAPEDGHFLTEEAMKRMPTHQTEEERRPFEKPRGSTSAPHPATAFRRHGK
jgi:hypothetical protein